jgi:hypothetical protein
MLSIILSGESMVDITTFIKRLNKLSLITEEMMALRFNFSKESNKRFWELSKQFDEEAALNRLEDEINVKT